MSRKGNVYKSFGRLCAALAAGSLDAPWEYIEKCQIALEAFDEAVSWSEIDREVIEERLAEELGGDEDANVDSEQIEPI